MFLWHCAAWHCLLSLLVEGNPMSKHGRAVKQVNRNICVLTMMSLSSPGLPSRMLAVIKHKAASMDSQLRNRPKKLPESAS